MSVNKLVSDSFGRRKLHFTLLDPEKNGMIDASKIRQLDFFGTDAFMVGGSTNVSQKNLDALVEKIKKNSKKPVILFPGGLSGLSKKADAVFFMSLLNSRNPDWIIGAQAKASTLVKELCIEPVSMAYVIVEPGMAAGRVGEADLIKKSESRRAVCYALAAQYFGFSLVYLEAGSGASSPVPREMISAVRKSINIPLIVGGGIRSARQALEAVNAGADIIVTGTIIEEKFDTIKEIINAVKS